MTYSIIDTRDVCGPDGEPVGKPYQTLHAAEAAWLELCTVREYISGQHRTEWTTAALHHRIRNDATGNWVAADELHQQNSAANRLRQLIEQGGYSQRSAAKELEISERTMRYYCSGKQPVPRIVMLAMEHLVDCPPK